MHNPKAYLKKQNIFSVIFSTVLEEAEGKRSVVQKVKSNL